MTKGAKPYSKTTRTPWRNLDAIRLQILDEMGVEVVNTPTGIRTIVPVEGTAPHKTKVMRLTEEIFGLPLEQLLVGDTEYNISIKLDISRSTVSKWRTQLGLTWSWRNLPSCTNCVHFREQCLVGDCVILIGERQPDLARTKKELILKRDSPSQNIPKE